MTISKNEVFIGLAGPNLDLLCVRQLDAVPVKFMQSLILMQNA